MTSEILPCKLHKDCTNYLEQCPKKKLEKGTSVKKSDAAPRKKGNESGRREASGGKATRSGCCCQLCGSVSVATDGSKEF